MGKKVFDKRTIWCPFPDCFSCPHPDCIKSVIFRPMPKDDASPQGKAAKEKTEARLDRERARSREYYRKNQAIIKAAVRRKHAREREAETHAEK